MSFVLSGRLSERIAAVNLPVLCRGTYTVLWMNHLSHQFLTAFVIFQMPPLPSAESSSQRRQTADPGSDRDGSGCKFGQ